MTDADLGQKYMALKQRYVEGLPDRLNELKASWNRLQHVSWDIKALSFMDHCAHKLSGSGTTFQCPEISHYARLLEDQLKPLLNKSSATPAERNQIQATLQMLEHAVDEASNTSSAEPVLADAAPEGQKTSKIAVIEDDRDQATMLRTWLEHRGFTVDIYETPSAYAQQTEHRGHHLILLDISFPDGALEGIAWLEGLKCQVAANIPVIMMSARSDMVARMRALRAGADIYLTKPLDFGVLEKRIEQLLEHKAAAKPRVLWVDDDSDLLAYYQAMLAEEGYEVAGLSQPARILEKIEQFQPDAIVLDHEMPGIQGMEVAKVLRQDVRHMTIPILFVSASESVSEQLDKYSMASNEFFSKPLDESQFKAALHHHLVQAQLLSARISLVSQRIEKQGLQNYEFFLNELGTLLAYIDATPENQPHFLIQAGIDRAEYLRAQHGSRALSRLTSELEHHFAKQLGARDTGCSLGGGSFLFQVTAPETAEAGTFLDTFHQRLNSQNWSIGDPPTPVTVSMGVLPLTNAMNEDRALLEVEKACCEAMQKANGGSIVWQQIPERSHQADLDERIHNLLQTKAFKLHYQPLVNMDSGDALFEALVRLVDEDGAIYLPGQFLPRLTEGKNESIQTLDRWVIEHAIQGLSKLEGKAAASHAVAIKFSSPVADITKMMPFLSSGMRNARIKGKRRIYLALSGNTVMKDVTKTKQLLEMARGMECGLVIEHIEAGPASVDLFRELGRVDYVKLAPQYGAKSEQTAELEAFLSKLTEIFGSSLPIVATRVEDAQALSWFWERGIRNFQGHFIQVPEVAMSFEF